MSTVAFSKSFGSGRAWPVTASPLATFSCRPTIAGFHEVVGVQPVLDCGGAQWRWPGCPRSGRSTRGGRTASRPARPDRGSNAGRGVGSNGLSAAGSDSDSVSWLNRHSSLGRQNWRRTTPATRLPTSRNQVDEARSRRSWTRRIGSRRTCRRRREAPARRRTSAASRSSCGPARTGSAGREEEGCRPAVPLEGFDVELGHLAERQDGGADRSPGHRRGVGDQAEQGRLKRLKTETHEECGRDGYRAPNPAAPSMKAPNEKATSTA